VTFSAPGGAQGSGRQACLDFYAGWLNAFSDGRVDVHRVHFVDDIAVEEGTFSGTHDGVLPTPAGEIPATGRRVNLPYIQVLRFRDGKHASFNLSFDRLLMLEQLGLSPAPTATG
jgi:predicted ester cyclase